MTKIKKLAPWEEQHAQFERFVDKAFKDGNLNGESEAFAKKLLVEIHRVPPWDFGNRVKTATDLLAERYQLAEPAKQSLSRLMVGQSIGFTLKYGSKLLPVLREALDTRLANKPITPEQVARWTQTVRPILEEAYASTVKRLGPEIQTLTPEQQAAINKDLAVVDKHLNGFFGTMKNHWEKGKWSAANWGLENDPIQQGRLAAVVDQPDRPREESERPESANRFKRAVPSAMAGGTGPMRLGETGGDVKTFRRSEGQPLPDESLWVQYVRSFCERYGLDEAQKAAAEAILKDLQEQAQTYRGSRSAQIKELQDLQREATSAEERREVEVTLRDVLKGIDDLFEELKARLNSIPTQEQMRRAG
ncbi:MAG: hypothetical protein JXQ73_24860 [Phycisphaerae bacterium]|nr:hypothetical protein [Phycisphaerae bacterium]